MVDSSREHGAVRTVRCAHGYLAITGNTEGETHDCRQGLWHPPDCFFVLFILFCPFCLFPLFAERGIQTRQEDS